MMLHEVVDVLLTVEASVQHQLEFFKLYEVHILYEVFDGFYIGYVTRKFPVVYKNLVTLVTLRR